MLIRNPDGPAVWVIERRGESGDRYKLRFVGTRLHSIGHLNTYMPDTPYASQYWRRIFTMPSGLHNPRPRGKLVTRVFRDLGIPINSFTRGRHVRFTVSG